MNCQWNTVSVELQQTHSFSFMMSPFCRSPLDPPAPGRIWICLCEKDPDLLTRTSQNKHESGKVVVDMALCGNHTI